MSLASLQMEPLWRFGGARSAVLRSFEELVHVRHLNFDSASQLPGPSVVVGSDRRKATGSHRVEDVFNDICIEVRQRGSGCRDLCGFFLESGR